LAILRVSHSCAESRTAHHGHLWKPKSMTISDQTRISSASNRAPWNKGKLTGARPPLRPKHVWSIRTKLQVEERTRDLAMFNLAIDSKLRGCDLVALKVEDIAPNGPGDGTPEENRAACQIRIDRTDATGRR
jgi:hypothetical protein